MPELSELYMFVCMRVRGKNLDAREVNPLLREYNTLLRQLKVEEQRNDGKIFKAWVQEIDEFEHQILDKETLLCSIQVRWNIFDPLPHGANNYAHSICVKLHEALMAIVVDNGKTNSKKIVIKTMDTHIPGNTRTGRWPREKIPSAIF